MYIFFHTFNCFKNRYMLFTIYAFGICVKNILIASVECEAWDYGLLCEKVCDCSRGTSTGCDSQTGACQCLPGWSGKTCNCRMTTDNCHAAFSYCYGNQCLCKDGQYESGVTCSGLCWYYALKQIVPEITHYNHFLLCLE